METGKGGGRSVVSLDFAGGVVSMPEAGHQGVMAESSPDVPAPAPV